MMSKEPVVWGICLIVGWCLTMGWGGCTPKPASEIIQSEYDIPPESVGGEQRSEPRVETGNKPDAGPDGVAPDNPSTPEPQREPGTADASEPTTGDRTTGDTTPMPDSPATPDEPSQPDAPAHDAQPPEPPEPDAPVPDTPPRGKCASGPAAPLDLGAAPGGSFQDIACIEIRNDRSHARQGELAFSSIPLPRGLALTDTTRLVLVGPGERRLQAQLRVISRWAGSLQQQQKPIRWLEIGVLANVAANATSVYSLRLYGAAPAAASDAYKAAIAAKGSRYAIDTGVLQAEVDPANPALFASLKVRGSTSGSWSTIYQHKAGAGPRLELPDGTVLDSKQGLKVASGGFAILERGPVKVVVQMRGYFVHPTHGSVNAACGPGGAKYDRFGYTMIATFVRGQRDVGLQYHFRNECGDAQSPPWTDQAVRVARVSWEFPTLLKSPKAHVAGSKGIFTTSSALKGEARIEQRKEASGQTWSGRQATVALEGKSVSTETTLDRPLLALQDPQWAMGLQLAWMRYREPQALVAKGQDLSLQIISASLLVGEAKGIWNVATLRIAPASSVSSPTALEQWRSAGLAQIERGLLPRVPLDTFNQAKVFPHLGDDKNTLVKKTYLGLIERLHNDTVKTGGQWDKAKTFGSQLWPDIQYDVWAFQNNKTPYQAAGAMNYWNPMGAELLEYFRSGDPKWVWDFAMPQAYLQMFSAYYNIGERTHGNRNGLAVTSGGAGEGQWHRAGGGSSDYSYNQGLAAAYLIRPHWPLLHRFRQAGVNMSQTYARPKAQQSQRDPWVDAVEISRFAIQRMEMIANCAAFVPGAEGHACAQRLTQIMGEFATDNFAQGVMCGADVPSRTGCRQPQQFMINSMMAPFFHRYLLNFGDINGLRSGLARASQTLYQRGIAKNAQTGAIDLAGCWWSVVSCSFNAAGTQVASCQAARDSDNNLCLYAENKPQTLATILLGHMLAPQGKLCAPIRAALDQKSLYQSMDSPVTTAGGGGWYKPTAQIMQALIYAVGAYDTCKD